MAVYYSKQLMHLLLVAHLIAATKTQPSSNPNCKNSTKCGNVSIPFPFGTRKECSYNSSFLITCNKDTPFLKNNNQTVPVLEISLDGELIISLPAAGVCVNKSIGNDSLGSDIMEVDLTPFQLSWKRNKFTVVGAETGGVLRNDLTEHSTACVSLYDSFEKPESCSGIFCCQTDQIPQRSSSFFYYAVVNVFNSDYTGKFESHPCGYAFLVETESFHFPISNIDHLSLKSTTFPVVVDWAIDSSYARKSNNSYCYDRNGGHGHLCNCSTGFRGNPYLQGGCQDINECTEKSHDCSKDAKCTNIVGNYSCYCPHGYEGDGRQSGTRCNPKGKSDIIIVITLSVSAGILTLLGGTFYVYYTLKKRKFIKLKSQFFQQNGGLFLQQQIAKHNGSDKMTKVFTIEELKQASNNFDEGMILGQGGQGTVYKGIFPDKTTVAIKKSKISNSNQVEQFINEVIMLSQINHRNVVKLLGCCLETEVPLLVYEFIPNGTVYEHLHDQRQSLRLTWKTRLRIATETAQALAYLHFATSTPIIHRDVKTANILLDHNLIAKVSDFGASRIIPLDQTQVTTLVQGTLGYLDPEYFRTSQLTEKSDVYSFGVVLTELLTGKKALSFDRPETHRNLAMHFDSSMKEGQLLHIVDRLIVDEASVEELTEVANIARHCLRLMGEERPTMKEVAMELEGICTVEKHKWENTNLPSAETENFLNDTSYALDIVDGNDGRGTSSGFDTSNQISMSLNNGR